MRKIPEIGVSLQRSATLPHLGRVRMGQRFEGLVPPAEKAISREQVSPQQVSTFYDLDGNGRADVVLYELSDSPDSPVTLRGLRAAADFEGGNSPRFKVEERDGRVSAIAREYEGVYVSLGDFDGDGRSDSVLMTHGEAGKPGASHAFVADENFDGRVDRINFGVLQEGGSYLKSEAWDRDFDGQVDNPLPNPPPTHIG